MMWIHRDLNDSLLYCVLCTFMAQIDVKDRVVHETKGTIHGYIFSCIYILKNPLVLQERRKKKKIRKRDPNF